MAEDNINLRAEEVTEWGTTLAPITKYLEPQNPIKKVDISTGNVNYIYPLTTDKQVILEDKTRLNTKITQLNAAILELNDLIAQVVIWFIMRKTSLICHKIKERHYANKI